MRIERGLLGFLSVFLALQLGWSQLDADLVQQPTLDPKLIESPFVPNELVVGLESGGWASPIKAMEMVGTIVSHNPPINAYVVRLADGLDMQSAGEFLRALPGVRYVEPNYLAFTCATPNDPRFSQHMDPRAFKHT